MQKNDWASVLGCLEVFVGEIRTVPESVLPDFESRCSFILPASYRGFCKTIGAGELDNNYRFKIPGVKSTRVDLEGYTQGTREEDPNNAQMQRSWFFATDLANTKFFWDPSEITDAADHEYAIYGFDENCEIKRVADSFWDFFIRVCMEGKPESRAWSYTPTLYEAK